MLTKGTKLLYGIGFSARGIKDGLFQIFLFFYFSQVLGLDAALAGTASLIALLFDAISDPLVGFWSDKHKSKRWGRRHPFMIWSAIPLGLFTYFLFMPPNDIGQLGLFLWLTVFNILVRVALTFFIIPHISLGAELTDDYNERTVVTSYRIMFASLVSPIVMIIGFTQFFIPTTEYVNGLFNVEAYPRFAMFCGLLMSIFIFISVFGTKHVIPSLPKANLQERLNISGLLSGLKHAIKMVSFRSLVGYMMLVYVAIGVGVIMTTYFATYYFELSENEMAFLPIGSAVGGVIALILAPIMGRILDKKGATIVSTVLFSMSFSLPYLLRMAGLFPENGSALILPSYILTITLGYVFLWIALSMGSSMMAEVVDQYELYSGYRQEGMFFSVMSFAYKCSTGLGTFIAGLLLSVISFPKQIGVIGVSAEAIDGLGLIGGPFLLFTYLLSLIPIMFYPIDGDMYQRIRSQLNDK